MGGVLVLAENRSFYATLLLISDKANKLHEAIYSSLGSFYCFCYGEIQGVMIV